MNKKIYLIFIPIILMVASAVFIIYNNEKEKIKTFTHSGYILASSNNVDDSQEILKYYFNENEKYKEKYNNKIIFSDTEGDEVTTSLNNFLHYNNGSISSLTDGVIIDLDKINVKPITYYNIFKDTMLNKNGDKYIIESSKNNISFNNYIWKIDENKYIIVSKNLKLIFDKEENETNDYLEINFLDGGIVKLLNQKVSYQTVVNNSYIILENGIKLNLNNRYLSQNDEEVASLDQMVVNSDDNINIKPKTEKKESKDNEQTDDNSNNQNQNGNNTNNNSTIQNNADNNSVTNNNLSTDENSEENNEEGVTNEIQYEPKFIVSKFKTSAISMLAEITISDDNNTINSDITSTIIDTASGKMVYSQNDSSGITDITVSTEQLNPNKEYLLKTNTSYVVDGIEYQKDFVYRIFNTDSLGLSFEKDYFTDSKLAFKVSADNYTTVKSANLELLNDKGEVIKSEMINVDTILKEGDLTVVYDDLTSNTNYTLSLTNFEYDGAIITDGYEIKNTYKTLKAKPVIGDSSYTIDKRNSLFNIKLNEITDKDGGILNYRYELYDARTLSDSNASLVFAIEKNSISSVDINVDDTTVFRGIPYVYKIVVEFYDNEKTIEYSSEFSNDILILEGVQFPTLNFDMEEVTFERIKGTINIDDIGNSIKLGEDSKILVTYKDSTGNTRQFTSMGTLAIPFDRNNLRANETYTISVYADIDLQDNNALLTNCYIGSVVVKTKETNPFYAEFSDNKNDLTNAFSVNFTLSGETQESDVSMDSESNVEQLSNTIKNNNPRIKFLANDTNVLEAKTLTSLTFNLYAGQLTNTTPLKTIRKVDNNLNEYISELKENYYDQTFKLTPEFFGIKNKDLIEEYYTIEITGAYDYTDYKNNINIINAKHVVRTNGVLPDLPANINDAVTVEYIRNKNAGLREKSYLNPDTIVGYNIMAKYDNKGKYLKKLHYNIWDANKNKLITTIDRDINPDGIIPYETVWLEDGTEFNIDDTVLTRGNSYYITYYGEADLTHDNVIDVTYPADASIILKSITNNAEKQEPIINVYPSISTSNTFTWKYKISDVDKALINYDMVAKINDVEKSKKQFTINNDEQVITFDNLNKGPLTLSINQALIKNNSFKVQKQIANQEFFGLDELTEIEYIAKIENNKLVFEILNYEDKKEELNKIASYNVKIKNTREEKIINNLDIVGNSLSIDLFELNKFVGSSFNVELYVYYDSGISGIDLTDENVALQMIKNNISEGYYYSPSESTLNKNVNALGSIYNSSYLDNRLILNSLLDGNQYNLNLTVKNDGKYYNNDAVQLKSLKKQVLTNTTTEELKFNSIIPKISIINDKGKDDITTTLNKAEVKMRLYESEINNSIEDDKLYLDIYPTTTNRIVKTVEVNKNELNDSITIDELNPKQEYYFKVWANILNVSTREYEKQYLYDLDYEKYERQYYFSTLSEIGISNIKIYFTAKNYSTKNIKLTYSLEQLIGFDEIKYEVYENVETTPGKITLNKIDIDIPSDKIFNKNMTKLINCKPGSVFKPGVTYTFKIIPIANIKNLVDGSDEKVELGVKTKTYKMNTLKSPYAGITYTNTTNTGINFKVSILDSNKSIVNDQYTVKIYEKNKDITPDNFTGYYLTTSANKQFLLQNLKRETEYKFCVNAITDPNNSFISEEFQEFENCITTITPNDYDLNIGRMVAQTNKTASDKIDLVFYESYNIGKITSLNYTIYNTNTGYSISNIMDFVPNRHNTDELDDFYDITLPDSLTSSGLYYIELQFKIGEEIVSTNSVEYTYNG